MALANFQTAVQKRQAKGIAGDKATLNPFVYTDRNYFAGDGAVTVGNFVWEDPANPAPGAYEGSGVFSALSSGTGAPLGIVERNHSYVNYDLLDGGTLVVPQKALLNVVRRGDLYAVAATAATKGQKVFAVLADGSLKTGAAGDTVAGAVETAWEVAEGGAAGDLITITNWNADVVINNISA
ncbi:MAG: DUF4646 domain-containing protein [Desulfovibrio sp.]|jgi:hypothetical protein|nr:DUF4646 domain-containing protein [Desulfovibrio sp.]